MGSNLNKEILIGMSCAECSNAAGLLFDFSFAFQPIVDIHKKCVWSYEALVRGINGESAYSVLNRVDDNNRYRFDQACRVKIIQLATRLGMKERLNINFSPNAIYKPELCIRTTLAVAKETGFPIENIVFEITEGEKIRDEKHLMNIIETYKHLGFSIAIDDFGAGYAGLNLLATYQPDSIKLDIVLIKDIHKHLPRQAIVKAILSVCNELNITLVAEGVETKEEYQFLKEIGIRYFQGYYFARPAFETLEIPEAVLY